MEAAERSRDKTKEGVLWTEFENRILKKRYLSDAKERHVQVGLDRHTDIHERQHGLQAPISSRKISPHGSDDNTARMDERVFFGMKCMCVKTASSVHEKAAKHTKVQTMPRHYMHKI